MSAVASNAEEDYELRLWMLNLFAHYVAVNKNWFETADEPKYWGKLPTDADEEETAAPITSAAHPRGVKKDTGGVSFAFPEGGRCWSEGKQQ